MTQISLDLPSTYRWAGPQRFRSVAGGRSVHDLGSNAVIEPPYAP